MSRDRSQDGTDRPVAPDDEPVANEQPGQGDATPQPHDAVGAYVLDALPEEERLAFAAHLASCADCQREVGELQPVVSLLPRLLELDPAPAFAGDAPDLGRLPNPTRSLRGRILAAAREEQTADHLATPVEEPPGAPEQAPAVEPDLETDAALAGAEPDLEPKPIPEPDVAEATAAPEPESAPAALPTRPPGRIRPGALPEVAPTSIWQRVSRRDRQWLAAAVLAVVAVGAIIWALALQGRVGDKDDEIAAQRREIATQEAELADLRDAGNASVALLGPTEVGPDAASGRLFIPLSQDEGVLVVEGMAQLPADRIYQLWYLAGEGTAPQPGPIFQVDEDGRGTAIVSSDAPTFTGVAITEEPENGSEAPTTAILLLGELGGARG
ncbi:MAG: anti-sigma factor domain-containing protein [Thermomicrobiales bacterium]